MTEEPWPDFRINPPTPVEVTTYAYDGPGLDANLLGVFQPGEEIVVDVPQVWVRYELPADPETPRPPHLPSLHEGSVHRETDEERSTDGGATSVQSKHILWASCMCGWRGPTHWADWEPDRFGRLAPTNAAHGKAEADLLAHLAAT